MKKVAIIGGSILVVLFLIGVATSSSNTQSNTTTKEPAKQEVAQQPTATPAPEFEYEELARISDKTDENISILIKPGETDPQGLASEVQKTCKKQCNITLFDDKKAFELDAEYTNKMMSYDVTVAEREAWKKKNTVFLAEHLVGQVGYSFGPYAEYPLKDWYYKELKGIK